MWLLSQLTITGSVPQRVDDELVSFGSATRHIPNRTTLQCCLGGRLLGGTTAKESDLLLAATNGDVVQVRRFLDLGADVNCRDESGWTPLISAAFGGHAGIVKHLLLIEGVDVSARDCDGMTAFYLAACEGYVEVVRLMLAVPDIDVNVANNNGDTGLIGAAVNGHTQVVELLLSKGADVTISNNRGMVPLQAQISRDYHRSEVAYLPLTRAGARIGQVVPSRWYKWRGGLRMYCSAAEPIDPVLATLTTTTTCGKPWSDAQTMAYLRKRQQAGGGEE